MANINKITKWDLTRDFVNLWLKEPTMYCNNCDTDYIPNTPPCCEKVQLGNNMQHTTSLVKALKEIRETRINQFASTKTNTIRWGVSLPPRLYHDLNRYFKLNFGHKLFDNQKNMRQFAKKFPEFKVPERI